MALRQLKTLKESGYFGLYRGEVVDNKDPLNSGRVKIKVYGIYDGIAKQDIPWAPPLTPYGGGPKNNYGSVYIPRIGSIAYVMFDGGEVSAPVFMGASPMKSMIPAEINTPNKHMVIKTTRGSKIYVSEEEDGGIQIASADGHLIELDDVNGRLRLRDRSGSVISMENGDIIIQAKRNIHLNPGS